MHIQQLKIALKSENALIATILDQQTDIMTILEQQRWEGLTEALEQLQVVSTRFEKLDQERHALVQAVSEELGTQDLPFLQLIDRLPAEEQAETLDLYRSFRVGVIRLKAGAARLTHYIRTLSDSIGRVLEEFLPHRKGRLYSRTGRQRAVGDEAVILDRKL